jgi:hypothetical protein
MEKESFENEEVAEVMNRYFVNIKVDREVLPEVPPFPHLGNLTLKTTIQMTCL